MQENIRNYMKLGLLHFMAYPKVGKGEGPIAETFRKIALDDYFEAAEITWIKDADVRQKVKKMIETSRLTVAYCAHPRLLTTGQNINDLNEENRQTALANLKEGIDEAYEIGAVGFAFLSGKYAEETKEESYQALVKSTRELCAYAKAKGDMPVLLEIFDYDIDKKSLIGPAAIAKRFAEEITKDFSDFGLLADLSHIPIIHETNEESLLPIKDYIKHAHMGNCVIKYPSQPGFGDSHPRFGFPGGENDVDELAAFLKVLLDIGFLNKENRPIVSFEIKPFGDEDPDLVIANAKRTLNLAWEKV